MNAGSANPGKNALVLSGGGANGAYEVGVLEALSRGRSPSTDFEPAEIDIYAGTSVGAYNATFLASWADGGTRAAADRLAEVWSRRIADRPGRCGNGVYRLRLGLLDVLNLPCLARRPLETVAEAVDDTVFLTYTALARAIRSASMEVPLNVCLAELFDVSVLFSTSPMRSLIRDTIDPDRLRRSTKPIFIATTNWTRGDLRVYDRDALLEPRGLEILIASATFPGILPPVTLGGDVYVDGGVLMNSPIAPALAEGAGTIHIVFPYPRTDKIGFNPMPSTVGVMLRFLTIIWNNLINRELVKWAETLAISRVASGLGSEKIVIHKYMPRNLPDFTGMLNFSGKRIARLMELGFHDTINHDCTVNKCVTLPAAAISGSAP